MNEYSEKSVTYYLVPTNVTARFEFFSGFGWHELKFVLVAIIIGVIIFFSLGIFKKSVFLLPEEISYEMTVGISEEDLMPNDEGYIEFIEDVIPPFARALFIIFPVGMVFVLVRRDPLTGISIINNISNIKSFMKEQKLYLYKYKSGSGE